MKRLTKTDLAALAILFLAAGLRFHDLSLRPFHHDEGVNGFFLTRLVREGVFNYDPSNYHGPTLYYLTLPLVGLLGLSDAALRGTTALFGVLSVFALWRFLSRGGAVIALSAMALLATSPGAVFFSRYFIHEALFVAFTIFALAAAPSPEGRPRWRFVATGVALGLLFATKETAFVSAGAMIGGAVTAAWLVLGISPLAVLRGIKPYAAEHAENLLHGLLAFIASAGLMYSSFFRNPMGVIDAFRTFAFWTKTAVRDHENPWHQHFEWLREGDPALIYLGFAGVLLALLLRRSFIAVMAAVWTLLLFFAYGVVKYKTPWLGLNMLLPLAITAGYALQWIAGLSFLSGRLSMKPVAVLALVGASGFSAVRSYDFETRSYDNEEHAYVYAHTQRAFLDFVRLIEARVAILGTGKDTGIAVFAPENWPMAWYLRDYKKIGYWGEVKADIDADMYVVSEGQDPQMAIKTAGKYDRFGPHHMRGVVNLVLYVKRPEGSQPVTAATPQPPEQ
jgi:uncharacterized protein (TIGR03663 family)